MDNKIRFFKKNRGDEVFSSESEDEESKAAPKLNFGAVLDSMKRRKKERKKVRLRKESWRGASKTRL